MKVFLKNVGIILIVVIVCASAISMGNLWALRSSSFYKPSFLVNDIKTTTFDYVILGASTGLTTLNTFVIDSIASTKGLNLSIDDSGLSTHYMMLQHFLAQGKTTSYCVLAPSNTSFDLKENILSGNDYRFLPFVNETYVYDHFSKFDSQEAKVLTASKWIPLFGVSYYNTELFYPSLVSLFNPKKRNRFDEKGNYVYQTIHVKDIPITKRSSFEVDFSNPYMDAIKKLCDANGIKLICYIAPMRSREVVIIKEDYEVINQSSMLTNERYFYDGIHVNAFGQEASSLNFAEQFKSILGVEKVK